MNPVGRKDVLPLPLRLREKREGGGGGGGGGVAVAVELSEVDCGAATTASVAAARRLARCEAAAEPAMTTTRERDARIAVEAAGRVIGVAIESEEEKEETEDEWSKLPRSPHFPPFFLFWLGREERPDRHAVFPPKEPESALARAGRKSGQGAGGQDAGGEGGTFVERDGGNERRARKGWLSHVVGCEREIGRRVPPGISPPLLSLSLSLSRFPVPLFFFSFLFFSSLFFTPSRR